jgi:hypothetical protein
VEAAGKTLGYLQSGGGEALIAEARHRFVRNASGPHDYKYPEAVFESHSQFSDVAWRNRFLSSCIVHFMAPATQPRALVAEILELLKV